MKSFRLIALSVIVTVSSFCAVVYTSCTKDECKNVTCLNGGTCSGGTCTCPTGYTGSNCATRAFVGIWNGSDVCSPSGTFSVTVTLANSSTDTTKVLITNPGGFGTNNTINGVITTDAKTITYSDQMVTSIVGTLTYHDTLSGTMTLTDNTHFTHNYTDKSGATFTCSGQYTKQ